jgi:aryl-alcohol dehydrogenase-like predicted oxidoreductase
MASIPGIERIWSGAEAAWVRPVYRVSPLGLGTVKFGRNQGVKYPQPFELPSDQEALALLERPGIWGINLLDTAPAYGVSEERLGRLLRQCRRDWVIVTKVGEEFDDGVSRFDFSAAATRASVERSLRGWEWRRWMRC